MAKKSTPEARLRALQRKCRRANAVERGVVLKLPTTFDLSFDHDRTFAAGMAFQRHWRTGKRGVALWCAVMADCPDTPPNELTIAARAVKDDAVWEMRRKLRNYELRPASRKSSGGSDVA